MSKKTRVHSFNIGLRTRSEPVDFRLRAPTAEDDLLSLETSSAPVVLSVPRGETRQYPLAEVKAADVKTNDYPVEPGTTTSRAYEIYFSTVSRAIGIQPAAGRPETRAVEIYRPQRPKTSPAPVPIQVERETTDVKCIPPEGVKTFSSPYLEHAPLTRYKLNSSYIPYPVLTDYMGALARKYETTYTDIKLIGIFDPVPAHLMADPVIDTDKGILKFNVRKEPADTGGRRFVRVVYGRRRSTGGIVSAYFPIS